MSFKKLLFLVGLLTLLGFIYLYHNNRAYILFNRYVNVELHHRTGFDVLNSANELANALDIVGLFRKEKIPFEKQIYLKLDSINFNKIYAYARSFPPIKKKLGACLKIEGEEYDCKVKLHGTHPIHYSNNKFSYSVVSKH